MTVGELKELLEDFDDVLSVFIHAPLESRVKRVKEEYKEEPLSSCLTVPFIM